MTPSRKKEIKEIRKEIEKKKLKKPSLLRPGETLQRRWLNPYAIFKKVRTHTGLVHRRLPDRFCDLPSSDFIYRLGMTLL